MRERIRLRRDSASNWSANNPILGSGEPGVELDTNKIKIGNGVDSWSILPYIAGGGSSISQLIIGDQQNDRIYWNPANRLNMVGSGVVSVFFDDATDTITISGTPSTSTNNIDNFIPGTTPSGLPITTSTNGLTVATGISSSLISNFGTAVSGLLPLVTGNGYVQTMFSGNTYTISATGLQPSGNYITSIVGSTGIFVSGNGSTYTIAVTGITGGGGGSSNVTISNYGNDRILTSDGSASGINAENGLTFDGKHLSISSGLSANTGNFTSSLVVSGYPVSVSGHTHSTTDISKYDSSIGDGVMSAAVGGAVSEPASVWKTRSLRDILDTILFPTINASISTAVGGSLTFDGNTASTQEVGTVISRVLTANLERGVITNGNGTIGPNVVGTGTSYTFSGTSISSSVVSSTNTYSFTHTTVTGSNGWSVIMAYAAGTGNYFNNKSVVGTNLDSSRIASNISRSSSTINGIYPYFYGVSNSSLSLSQIANAIVTNASTKVLSSSAGTVSVPFNGSNKFFWFAHIAADPTKTKWYRNDINKGDILDSSTLFSSPSTVNVNSPSGFWSNISYKVYITNYATILESSEPVQFRNS